MPQIGRVFLMFTMRAQKAIQAWQQDWPPKLARSTRQRGEQPIGVSGRVRT
jgi:hypothetical protein